MRLTTTTTRRLTHTEYLAFLDLAIRYNLVRAKTTWSTTKARFFRVYETALGQVVLMRGKREGYFAARFVER